MVICKFFLNGNCRFGSKCDNDHFDIKLHIETEVQGAINGNQWPLSCFGPFRDKPNIPNFIEDQSFEEVRHKCYEAKKQNCFPAFEQQFKTEVMQAQHKMKSLLTWNRDVQDTIMAVYSTEVAAKHKNPFKLGSNLFGNANSNQTAFGNTNSNHTAFGNSNTVSFNNSSVPNTSIFGNQNQTSTSGGIIGQSVLNTGFSSTPQPNASVFGGSAPAQQSANIFHKNNTPAAGGSIFSQQKASGSLFGNAAVSSTPFGGNTFASQSGTLFSMTPQQPNTVDSGNIFAQTAAQTQPVQGFGSFSVQQQQQQQTQQQQTQQPQTQQQQMQQSQFQTGGNIFAQAMQQPPAFPAAPVQPQQNIFTQQTTSIAPAFGASSQSVGGSMFGQPPVLQPPQQLPPVSNVQVQLPQFQPQLSQMHSQAPQFQSQPTQLQPQAQQIQQSNIFGQQAMQNPAFVIQTDQSQTFPQQDSSFQQDIDDHIGGSDSNIYSRIENLTQEQLDWFNADNFVVGEIPTVPPPKELC